MFSSGRLELDSEAARACIYTACRIKRYITNDKPHRWDACVLYCYYRYCYIIVIITIVINIFILIFFIINNNNAIIVVVVVSCHYRGLLLAPWLQYRHLLAVTGRQLPRVFVTRSCHNVYCWCGQGKVSGHDVSSDCSFLLLLLLLYIILV